MNILMIAYYFPPDASSGAFRPLYFSQYFKEQGETLSVLTPGRDQFLPEQPVDVTLCDPALTVVTTRVYRPREVMISLRDRILGKTVPGKPQIGPGPASSKKPSGFQRVKDFITTTLASPDAHIGWLMPAVKAGHRAIKERSIDLILATGGPWTGLVIGAVLKKMTARPLVLDFRDPWTSNPNFKSRPALIRRFESGLERWVLSLADLVIANTDALKADFLGRYPFLSGKVETVPNGYARTFPGKPEQNSRFTLTHAGNLYLHRNPVHLVRAVYNLICRGKIPKEKLRVQFVGGIDISDPELDRLLASPELENVISVIPRVSFNRACRFQQESDLLVILQPDFPLQIPRKLYESMAFGKFVLAVTEPAGATARLVEASGLGRVVENQTPDIETAIETCYRLWREDHLPIPDPDILSAYSNENVCRSLHRHLMKRFGSGSDSTQSAGGHSRGQ